MPCLACPRVLFLKSKSFMKFYLLFYFLKIMASRARGIRRGCYNGEEAFRVLMEDVDADEEDFEEIEQCSI